VSSIEEFIIGGLQDWEYCEKKLFFRSRECSCGQQCSFGQENFLVRSKPPFIGEWRRAASCCRVYPGLHAGLESCWHAMHDLLCFVRESVHGGIPYVLSIRDIPSVGLARLLAKG
jgi:hypothetical protein